MAVRRRLRGAVVFATNDARQPGLGCVSYLSKRGAPYAPYLRIDNGGAATSQVAGGPTGWAGGKSSIGTDFGVRHSF